MKDLYWVKLIVHNSRVIYTSHDSYVSTPSGPVTGVPRCLFIYLLLLSHILYGISPTLVSQHDILGSPYRPSPFNNPSDLPHTGKYTHTWSKDVLHYKSDFWYPGHPHLNNSIPLVIDIYGTSPFLYRVYYTSPRSSFAPFFVPGLVLLRTLWAIPQPELELSLPFDSFTKFVLSLC